MSLREEILAVCTPAELAQRDDAKIAAKVSQGRTRIVSRPGGVGAVMRTLGPEAGANLLNTLETLAASTPSIKWALVLIRDGSLDFGDPATRAQIDLLAGQGVITAAQATALKAIAVADAPVTAQDVARALEGL
jgi:hypothetical protein